MINKLYFAICKDVPLHSPFIGLIKMVGTSNKSFPVAWSLSIGGSNPLVGLISSPVRVAPVGDSHKQWTWVTWVTSPL